MALHMKETTDEEKNCVRFVLTLIVFRIYSQKFLGLEYSVLLAQQPVILFSISQKVLVNHC